MTTLLQNAIPKQNSRRTSLLNLILALLACYALLIYTVMTFRFQGNWGEGDTLVVTRAIVTSDEADSLLRAQRPYPNGVGYVSIVMFLSDITGFSPQTLQTFIMPLLAALNVAALFIAYRALLSSSLLGALAALFTYLQPDFLWVTWRGSHEKFTWMFVITLIFLLTRSFVMWNQMRIAARYIIAFYIVALALVSSNVFFAASFIFAIVISCVAGNLFFAYRTWRKHQDNFPVRRHIARLVYVNLACIAILYIFLVYLYPESKSALDAFTSLVDQLALLLFNVEEVTGSQLAEAVPIAAPRNYLRISWLSTYVFFGLTIFSWIILAISAIVWIVNALRVIRLRQIEQKDLPLVFHLVLYGAFAVQLAGALVADRVATLSSNLQVRLFTPLILTAIPLAALGIYQFVRWVYRWRQKLLRAVFLLGIGAAVFYFSVAAILKSTNEPLLNNWFIFATRPEHIAGEWSRTYLHDTQVWTGANDRLSSNLSYTYLGRPSENNVTFYGFGFQLDTSYYLLSSLELAMRRRLRTEPPFFISENIIYHNGSVAVYYRRPESPYQR